MPVPPPSRASRGHPEQGTHDDPDQVAPVVWMEHWKRRQRAAASHPGGTGSLADTSPVLAPGGPGPHHHGPATGELASARREAVRALLGAVYGDTPPPT
jgi:hypothetical protein